MVKKKIYCGLAMLLVSTVHTLGQGQFGYDYITASKLRDEQSQQFGSGNMQIWTGSYSIPISMNFNERGQPVAWSTNINASYATLANRGEAKILNPPDILNCGINLMHLRPIGKRWSIMAVTGCGIYASTDEISYKSILANGGTVFIYHLNSHIDMGIGAGVTNSYGLPMAMPILYFSWRQSGRFDFKIDMSNGLKISASSKFGKRLAIDLVALEMDGMAAVTTVDGKSKIYSSVILKSYICPTVTISPNLAIYIGVGGNWVRSISMTDRTLKAFFNSFAEENNDPYYQAALRLSAGIKYHF